MERLGIDIGGTGIKGAPVDVERGVLLADRLRLLTPKPATPKGVARIVGEVARHFDWHGPVGCTFPAVVKDGVTMTAANVDRSWIGVDAAALFGAELGGPPSVMNDADAAGLAEMAFGAGKGRRGVVLLITLGTGIGCALFHDGVLVPNTELGHIEVRGKDAETLASDRTRVEEHLSWKKYTKRLDRYFGRLEDLLSPDLIIIGGGGSKKAAHFIPGLTVRAEVVPAALLNDAGIVGAALAAR